MYLEIMVEKSPNKSDPLQSRLKNKDLYRSNFYSLNWVLKSQVFVQVYINLKRIFLLFSFPLPSEAE